MTTANTINQRFGERAVIDRLHRLCVILPAMAEEAAVARREAARLRRENARLMRRIAELQSRIRAETPGTPAPSPPGPLLKRGKPPR